MNMKKYLLILSFVFLPVISHAETDRRAGIEFLSPLVQQIVQLLYDRIHELNVQIDNLKFLNEAQSKSIVQCSQSNAPLGVVEVPPPPPPPPPVVSNCIGCGTAPDTLPRFIKHPDVTLLGDTAKVSAEVVNINRTVTQCEEGYMGYVVVFNSSDTFVPLEDNFISEETLASFFNSRKTLEAVFPVKSNTQYRCVFQ